MDENLYQARLKNDIEEFMKASKVWGLQGDADLRDKASRVFMAFLNYIQPPDSEVRRKSCGVPNGQVNSQPAEDQKE